jgi:hypothetical protein
MPRVRNARVDECHQALPPLICLFVEKAVPSLKKLLVAGVDVVVPVADGICKRKIRRLPQPG